MCFGMGPMGWGCMHPWGWSWYGTSHAGYGYWPGAAMPKEQEITMLEDQARALESDLDAIRKRLEELEK